MAEQPDDRDDDVPDDLSAEDQAIVRRGRALLRSLEGKPRVSNGLQARSDSASMDLEEAKALAEREKRDKV